MGNWVLIAKKELSNETVNSRINIKILPKLGFQHFACATFFCYTFYRCYNQGNARQKLPTVNELKFKPDTK